MARPIRRTPIGAWYSGYAGLKPAYDPFFSFCPNKVTYDTGVGLRNLSRNTCRSVELPNNSYDREAFLFDTDKDRASPTMAGHYYDKHAGSQSYRPAPVNYTQEVRQSSWEQVKGRDDAKDDLRLYGDTSKQPADDFKPLYDPSPRNGPSTELKLYDSSPRNGPAEREWELGRLSPRRITYEPSFHDPGVSPRKMLPWDRDRKSPGMCGEGHGRSEEVRGQGQSLDPLMYQMATTTTMPKQIVASKQAGSVFLFIRFHKDCFAVIGQTCQAARTRDLRGEYVGITDLVYDFGDMSGKNRCGYAVFQLPSLTSAEVFYNRDRNIRQPDFPRGYGDSEVFAINLQVDPGTVKFYQTFLLSEVTLNDGPGADSVKYYEETFAKPFTQLLVRHDALPYAAFCNRDNRRSLRRRHFDRNDFITLHLFRNLEHFEQVRADVEYSKLRGIHNTIAKEKCSLFTVQHVYCP